MMKQCYIILNIVTLGTTKPATGGMFNLKSNWWSGDIGSSGQYLTTKFCEAIFEPALRSIINTLEEMTSELRQSHNNDELFLAANILMALMIILSWFLIYKKIEAQRRQNENDN